MYFLFFFSILSLVFVNSAHSVDSKSDWTKAAANVGTVGDKFDEQIEKKSKVVFFFTLKAGFYGRKLIHVQSKTYTPTQFVF